MTRLTHLVLALALAGASVALGCTKSHEAGTTPQATVAATHADGSPVTGDELAELTGEQDELGKPPVMETIMASRTWKLGEVYAFNAAELLRLAEAKDGKGPQATELTMRLARIVGHDAEFAMTMKLESSDAPTMTMDITGTVTIDGPTGRPRRLEISGPVKGDAGGMPIVGTMSGQITYAFTDPSSPTR